MTGNWTQSYKIDSMEYNHYLTAHLDISYWSYDFYEPCTSSTYTYYVYTDYKIEKNPSSLPTRVSKMWSFVGCITFCFVSKNIWRSTCLTTIGHVGAYGVDLNMSAWSAY